MGLLGNLSKAALLAGIVGFCGACQQGGKDRADGTGAVNFGKSVYRDRWTRTHLFGGSCSFRGGTGWTE